MFARHKHIILLILFLILYRIPALILWSPNITGSDSSIYMETARNIAEGKGYVSSICRYDMNSDKLRDYVHEHGNRYQGWSRAPIYTYMMSGIYLITGKEHYMTGVNILNLLLFILSLVIIYRFMLQRYPDKKYAYFIAILWVGGSFTLYEYSFGAWLESYTLFNFVLIFAYHSFIVNNDNFPKWHYILYAFALASLFTIKRANMPMAVAFFAHLFLCRNFKRFFLVTGMFIAFTGLWYGLRFYVMDTPPMASFSHSFPYLGLSLDTSPLPRFIFSPKMFISVMREILTIAMDWRNLGLLTPFTIFYLAAYPNDRIKQAIWMLLLLNIGIYAFSRGIPNPRYIFPLFVPLIMYSAIMLEQALLTLCNDRQLVPRYSLAMVVIFFQIYCVANFVQWIPVCAKERDHIFHAADDILAKHGISEDAIIMSNIVGYNLYTNHGYVLTPPNTVEDGQNELFDLYKVDYVLHYDGLTRYFGWNEFTLKLDKFNYLPLIEESQSDHALRLYSTK